MSEQTVMSSMEQMVSMDTKLYCIITFRLQIPVPSRVYRWTKLLKLDVFSIFHGEVTVRSDVGPNSATVTALCKTLPV
jgi:hypothetical protein